MPTVLSEEGFDFVIWTREPSSEIPHVHVFRSGAEVKIALAKEGQRPYVLDPRNMKAREARKALPIIQRNQAYLQQKWEEIHGET